MPPGPKKRKAAKRKKAVHNHDHHHQEQLVSPTSPSRNPNPNPNRVEEGEETFETPTSQLDPIDYMPVERSLDRRRDGKKAEASKVVIPSIAEESEGLDRSVEITSKGRGEVVKSVPVDGEGIRKALIDPDEACSSSEKEVKVVPWPDEEIAGNGSLESEVQRFECLKEMKLGNSAEEPIPLTEDSVDVVVESVQQVMIPIDEDLRVKKLAEDSEGTKGTDKLLDTLSLEKEVKGLPKVKVTREQYLTAVQTEDELRIEVARGQMVVRRASLWNCCGLLEVLTSTDR